METRSDGGTRSPGPGTTSQTPKVFTTRDLYFCHFYIPEGFTRTIPENWVKRVVMIDLHRLARHPVMGAWWQAKDLAQLLYSSDVPGVTARDRARFWKLYRSQWPKHPPTDWLLPLIKWKWRLYQRHARRRKTVEASKTGYPRK